MAVRGFLGQLLSESRYPNEKSVAPGRSTSGTPTVAALWAARGWSDDRPVLTMLSSNLVKDERTTTMKFQVNEAPLDRFVRILIGLGLYTAVAAGLFAAPLLYGVLLVGTIGLVTGITGFCPTYVLLGISTIRRDRPAVSK